VSGGVHGPASAGVEVIFNLWYVYDDLGLIYSLRARAYVGQGTDEEKLELLRGFARTDYLIAQSFPVPARLQVSEEGQEFPVAPVSVLRDLDSPIAIFEEALRQLEAQFPAQSGLPGLTHPLVCVTPLFSDANGNIEPRFAASASFMGR
jgi:hypothetical protein